MDQGALLKELSKKSGYSLEDTRKFYQTFISVLAETLSQGEPLDCMPEWGKFIPKLRDNVSRNENSPNRLKKPYYFIQFKPGKRFEDQILVCSCQQNTAE